MTRAILAATSAAIALSACASHSTSEETLTIALEIRQDDSGAGSDSVLAVVTVLNRSDLAYCMSYESFPSGFDENRNQYFRVRDRGGENVAYRGVRSHFWPQQPDIAVRPNSTETFSRDLAESYAMPLDLAPFDVSYSVSAIRCDRRDSSDPNSIVDMATLIQDSPAASETDTEKSEAPGTQETAWRDGVGLIELNAGPVVFTPTRAASEQSLQGVF